ncbi:MAG: DEAD/DEAH box helicase [Verrucomicrobiota bacterium]
MEKRLFNELGLSAETLRAVAAMGFEEASPIQTGAIPPLLSGVDVVGQSQTGSGKTAAFAIPAIEAVDPALSETQVLILCPTRELAVQVAEETAKLASFKKGVRELPIYGGQSYDRQFRGLKKGAHIVIGTPGRILDHIKKGTLTLQNIKSIVMDEADRMLDMGFLDDIKTILAETPESRQTVLFSATVPKPVASLIKTFTEDPVWITIKAESLTVPEIDQVWYEVHGRTKVEVLCRLIDLEDVRFAIIFCATKIMVDQLVENLIARGYLADKLHGDMTQVMRERVMNRFRRRTIEFLVATDVAARGLDVKDIEVVFNFDLPNDGEDYVHRIGRTGRAGSKGKAITFVGGREVYKLQNIMRFTKGKIHRERVPTLEQVEERRANVFLDTLRSTLEENSYKRYDHITDRLLDQGYPPTEIISALMHLREMENPKAPGEEIPIIEESSPKKDRGPRKKKGPSPWKRGKGKGKPNYKRKGNKMKESYPGDFPKKKRKR